MQVCTVGNTWETWTHEIHSRIICTMLYLHYAVVLHGLDQYGHWWSLTLQALEGLHSSRHEAVLALWETSGSSRGISDNMPSQPQQTLFSLPFRASSRTSSYPLSVLQKSTIFPSATSRFSRASMIRAVPSTNSEPYIRELLWIKD